MKFESTPPRAPDAPELVSTEEALKHIGEDLVAVETRICANLKRIFAERVRGQIRMLPFEDLDANCIHKYPLVVHKVSLGFSKMMLEDDEDRKLVAQLLEGEAAVAAEHVLVYGENRMTVLDGLGVKLREVGQGLYSLSVSIKFTHEADA